MPVKQKKVNHTLEIILSLITLALLTVTIVVAIQHYRKNDADIRLEVAPTTKQTPQPESTTSKKAVTRTSKAKKAGKNPKANLDRILKDLGNLTYDLANKTLKGNLKAWQDYSEAEKESLQAVSDTPPVVGGVEDPEPPESNLANPELNLPPAYRETTEPQPTEIPTPTRAQPTDEQGRLLPTSPPPIRPSAGEEIYTGPTSPPAIRASQGLANGPTSPPANLPQPNENSQDQMPDSPLTNQGESYLPDAATVAAVQSEVFNKINADRMALGLNPLTLDSTLQTIANQRAVELSQYYHTGHLRPDHTHALNWISMTYGPQYGIGENIGWMDNNRRLSADRIYEGFYNSGKGHREIMMYPNISRGAIGIYCVPGPVPDNNTGHPNNSNKGRFFICMNFGN